MIYFSNQYNYLLFPYYVTYRGSSYFPLFSFRELWVNGYHTFLSLKEREIDLKKKVGRQKYIYNFSP